MVCKPEGTVKFISGVLGAVFILVGIYKIINYFVTKGENDFFNYNLIYGLTAIVIGIVAMAYMNIIWSVSRIIIGVWIVYTSFVRINSAIQIKKIGSSSCIKNDTFALQSDVSFLKYFGNRISAISLFLYLLYESFSKMSIFCENLL